MKLKNDALQELYDTVVANTITISPFAASPIHTAFRECDEKLSESVTFAHIKDLQERNDVLERSNATLLEANMDLASKNQKLNELNGMYANKYRSKILQDIARGIVYDAEGQAECFAEMYADMTLVDYPERFIWKTS